MDWHLECSDCGHVAPADGLPTVCSVCGRPYLVRYPSRIHPITERAEIRRRHGMWRYRSFLPLEGAEEPVTLGEGDTPLLPAPRLASAVGLDHILVKDEGTNPTGSFKSRGLSAAITRATLAGARQFVVPTAGNAGVASAAYAARAGATVRVYAPKTTPATILSQIVAFGADLVLLDGHIGDCGKAARAWATETGAVDLSTLREPYRIEGKKTLGLELALQLNWTLPSVIIYPTGGGTGLIGMWKAFLELQQAGWVTDPMPRFFTVQSTGCAPIVKAFAEGAASADPWPDPWTVASGLRVPGPLGDKLMLRILRESGGGAVAVPDEEMTRLAALGMAQEGIDFAPEGGGSLAAAAELKRQGLIGEADRVVAFNTGSGWLYRDAAQLLLGAT
ncbi:MAG TPA: threonine synthase [Gemmatimonadales bacterium]|jgi:threonine synthase|nr:threonine synthase [Gemmatimonadales bacterium]